MHERFLRQAVALATQNVSSGDGGPFGAVIVIDGRCVANGVNSVTSTNDPTAHAEVVAIRAACDRLGRFELRGGEIYSSCEPCPMCLAAIYWARLDRVYFAATADDAARSGFDDRIIYEELACPMDSRRLEMTRVAEVSGEPPFEAWLRAGQAVTPY